jgi:hypothetical protein
MTASRKPESARANGAKSRGPTTQEGKLASSQNATRHGISSRAVVLQCESQHRFEQVLAAFKDQIQPRNSAESGFVEMMAINHWRQMRFLAVQKAAIELEMVRVESANDLFSQIPAAGLTSVVLVEKLRRYETSYRRQFIRAKDAIQKMRRRQELFAAEDSASPSSNLTARAVPRLAAQLHAPTFMEPRTRKKAILQNEPTAQEKVILQNEPTTQNETCPTRLRNA